MIIPSKEQLKKIISNLYHSFLYKIILFFAAFIIPLLIIYFIDPVSFDYLWKGRAPYLLFLWLFFLETYLGWKNLKEGQPKFWTKKTALATVILILPTIYAIGLPIGLYNVILEMGKTFGVPAEQFGEWYLTHSWPFSFEYTLFAIFFLVSLWLLYGKRGLRIFAVSSFFIGGVSLFYMIDTFYPYGTFTLLQSFVPITVSVVIFILNIFGYKTETFSGGVDGLGLTVIGSSNSYSAIISWSCAGSHSLFLYSFMIMLFLRGTRITKPRKIAYVFTGATGTFFVNILRIIAILLAGVNSGASLATTFHEFYGEFFFITWMFIYLTIIYLLETRIINKSRILTKRHNKEKTVTSKSINESENFTK